MIWHSFTSDISLPNSLARNYVFLLYHRITLFFCTTSLFIWTIQSLIHGFCWLNIIRWNSVLLIINISETDLVSLSCYHPYKTHHKSILDYITVTSSHLFSEIRSAIYYHLLFRSLNVFLVIYACTFSLFILLHFQRISSKLYHLH